MLRIRNNVGQAELPDLLVLIADFGPCCMRAKSESASGEALIKCRMIDISQRASVKKLAEEPNDLVGRF
jgi:hypothetical protein